MDTAEKVLVIFLSGALALFLTISIILIIKIIQIIGKVREITEKVDTIADKAESISDFIEKTATPAALGRFVAGLGGKFLRRKPQH